MQHLQLPLPCLFERKPVSHKHTFLCLPFWHQVFTKCTYYKCKDTSALSRGSASFEIYFKASPFSSASMHASTNGLKPMFTLEIRIQLLAVNDLTCQRYWFYKILHTKVWILNEVENHTNWRPFLLWELFQSVPVPNCCQGENFEPIPSFLRNLIQALNNTNISTLQRDEAGNLNKQRSIT